MVATLLAARGVKPTPASGPEAFTPDWENQEVFTGTTIIAVQFDGGVVLGADSRTTTGSYIASQVTDKLTSIHDHIFCSAPDTQGVADAVTYQLGFHSIELNEPPLVHIAASLFKETRASVLSAYVLSMMVRLSFAIGRFGSSYIYDCVDATYWKGMTKEECLQFTANALALAMEQDGSSGEVICLATIAESGVEWQVLLVDQIPKFAIATLPLP
uniref:Proteasome subunit beta n=1 Tax=Saimiri boliviensis boliviensis TaxID=39432 RepID=A0A2K6TRQ9_SAIBB